MNAERHREPQLDRWFAERAATLREPREGFEEMLAMAAVTPQRHHRWWPSLAGVGARSGSREPLVRLAMVVSTGLAAVLMVVAFGLVSSGLFTGPDGPAPPAPAAETHAQTPHALEASAPPTVLPAPDPSVLATANSTLEAGSALQRYQAIVAGLELKALAPGISRVVADAIGRPLRNGDTLAIAPDGRIWIIKHGQLVEVGQRGGYDLPDGELHLGQDGRMRITNGEGVWELGEGGWQQIITWPEPETPSWFGWRLVGATDNGDLWATSPFYPRPIRIDGHGWTEFHPRYMDVEWPAGADLDRVGVAAMVVAADGSVWAWVRGWPDPREPWVEPESPVLVDALVRYDGTRWEQLAPPGGSLWPYDAPGLFFGVTDDMFHPGNGSSMWVSVWFPEVHLAHWDGREWSTVLAPRGPVVVDGKERVWSLKQHGDPALLRYDGSGWATHGLPAELAEITDLLVAPDDTLWARSEAGDLYVVDPEQMEFDGGDQA